MQRGARVDYQSEPTNHSRQDLWVPDMRTRKAQGIVALLSTNMKRPARLWPHSVDDDHATVAGLPAAVLFACGATARASSLPARPIRLRTHILEAAKQLGRSRWHLIAPPNKKPAEAGLCLQSIAGFGGNVPGRAERSGFFKRRAHEQIFCARNLNQSLFG